MTTEILDLLELGQEGLRSQKPFKAGTIAAILWDLAIASELDLQNTLLIAARFKVVILNYGMGVESTSIFKAYKEQPGTRPPGLHDLRQLLVITSQTGNEMKETKGLVEDYALPDFREMQVRYVQVAKASEKKADGYVVLGDSRSEDTCYIEGFYKLFDHLNEAGTSIRLGRPHTCAMRWKGEVIDAFLFEHLIIICRLHQILLMIAFGCFQFLPVHLKKPWSFFQPRYNATLHPRFLYESLILPCANKQVYGPILGYNHYEQDRIRKCEEYNFGVRGVQYESPLHDWKASREDCLEFLHHAYGVVWRRSACKACPFPIRATAALRYQREPEAGAEAAFTEYLAMAFNPSMHLFGFGEAMDLLVETHNERAIALFKERLQQCSWAIYRVDRLYYLVEREGFTKSGKPKKPRKDSMRRTVKVWEPSERSTYNELYKALQQIAEKYQKSIERFAGCDRVYYRKKKIDKNGVAIAPTAEIFWIIAPALIKAKDYHKSFEKKWLEIIKESYYLEVRRVHKFCEL